MCAFSPLILRPSQIQLALSPSPSLSDPSSSQSKGLPIEGSLGEGWCADVVEVAGVVDHEVGGPLARMRPTARRAVWQGCNVQAHNPQWL
ncbi:hypothetical protein BDA96_01G105700 [Sorghum bicolor]|uniref:Uncharacterized protein n=1 Tax=Sorghum bicolor TaxID=4558 RepID=A0A921UWQ4_SORBI|nr:hypothetical protein BDA96_01G105700 [Sorghum bicolor]